MINSKAIGCDTAVLILVYALHVLILLLPRHKLDRGEDLAIFAVSQILGIATCLILGYISARIAGERGLFYGFNVGALGTIFSGLSAVLHSYATGAQLPGSGLATLPFWIFVNGSLQDLPNS